jgi:hypothetical protein
MSLMNITVGKASPSDCELTPIQTETEAGFGLMKFDQVMVRRSCAENESRLGDLNPGPTHYECVALPLS